SGVTPRRPRSRHSGETPCQATLSISTPEEHFQRSTVRKTTRCITQPAWKLMGRPSAWLPRRARVSNAKIRACPRTKPPAGTSWLLHPGVLDRELYSWRLEQEPRFEITWKAVGTHGASHACTV